MLNSRQLVDQVASSLGWPVTEAMAHARNLREATREPEPDGRPLMTYGGRGRNAPAMTIWDGALLHMRHPCVADRRRNRRGRPEHQVFECRLPRVFGDPELKRERWEENRALASSIDMHLAPRHDVVEGLAALLHLLASSPARIAGIAGQVVDPLLVYAVFEVEYPDHFASMTLGIRDRCTYAWTYGARSHARTEQVRRCREDALNEIASSLARPIPPGGSGWDGRFDPG